MKRYDQTKTRMRRTVIFVTDDRDVNLLEAAARLEDVSRAQFLRLALRERAQKIFGTSAETVTAQSEPRPAA